MVDLQEVDITRVDFGDFYDELPIWSAPFGLKLLDCVPMRAGATYLDVGAGTGFLALELAQRCGAESRIIAIDPWPAGMARLRRKLEYLELRNVTLLEQDAAVTGLKDHSVDVIVSNLGVNNFDNASAVMAELFRVAKPDARLIMTTNLTGHMAEFYNVFRQTLIELGQTELIGALDEHIAHRGTLASMSRLLEGAGFDVVQSEIDEFRLRYVDGSAFLRHFFIRIGFIGAWKEIVAPSRVEEIFKALEQALNAIAAEKGELSMTIPVALIEARKDTP